MKKRNRLRLLLAQFSIIIATSLKLSQSLPASLSLPLLLPVTASREENCIELNLTGTDSPLHCCNSWSSDGVWQKVQKIFLNISSYLNDKEGDEKYIYSDRKKKRKKRKKTYMKVDRRRPNERERSLEFSSMQNEKKKVRWGWESVEKSLKKKKNVSRFVAHVTCVFLRIITVRTIHIETSRHVLHALGREYPKPLSHVRGFPKLTGRTFR